MAAVFKYANYDKTMYSYSFGTLNTELKSFITKDGTVKATLSMIFVQSRNKKAYATIVNQDTICSGISNSDPMTIKEWLPNAKYAVAPDRFCTIIFGNKAIPGRIIIFVLKEIVDSLAETRKQIADLTRELTGLKTALATCVNMAYEPKTESDGSESSTPPAPQSKKARTRD